MTKSDVSEVLKGFQRDEKGEGFEIFKVKGWDYPALVETYEKAEKLARDKHIPSIVHVVDMTQPTGHSTSGSHERYKSKERLQWEKDFDCLVQFKNWIIKNNIATEDELETIRKEVKEFVKQSKKEAWSEYQDPLKSELNELFSILNSISSQCNINELDGWISDLKQSASFGLFRRDFLSVARKVLVRIAPNNEVNKTDLVNFINKIKSESSYRYNTNLYNETDYSSRKIEEVLPQYSNDSEEVDGRIVLRDNFDQMFSDIPEAMIFGEDVGKIGGVNQGVEGLQAKYGELRVSDTGIRETTILGQGIGLSLRGLRPIAEMQYLDYLLYAFQTMADDIATLHYRTHGGQISPVIIRTRGHRLEGIWHSGSPMGMIIHGTRGVNICVPRNMTKAAGFYNTLMASNEPAMVVECLNSYRVKEKLPSNMGEFRTPLGIPETTKEGSDITIVTYGSTWRIVSEAAKQLEEFGISAEVIDVQTLVPLDINKTMIDSLKKTNRLLVVDEDVPGGASAYILQNIIEDQKGFFHLDSEPQTLAAKAHRCAYGKDGDYFSKPSIEDVFEKVYNMMNEVDPTKFPELY
jgi:pyruvate/2-oxoglutarate/acetoin dehydrogenase E1 component